MDELPLRGTTWVYHMPLNKCRQQFYLQVENFNNYEGASNHIMISNFLLTLLLLLLFLRVDPKEAFLAKDEGTNVHLSLL